MKNFCLKTIVIFFYSILFLLGTFNSFLLSEQPYPLFSRLSVKVFLYSFLPCVQRLLSCSAFNVYKVVRIVVLFTPRGVNKPTI